MLSGSTPDSVSCVRMYACRDVIVHVWVSALVCVCVCTCVHMYVSASRVFSHSRELGAETDTPGALMSLLRTVRERTFLKMQMVFLAIQVLLQTSVALSYRV